MRMVFTELLENRELVIEGLPDDDLTIFDHPLRKDELVQAAKGAEVLSVFIYTDIRKEVIEQLPDLKLIVTRSVGFDHIDAKHALDKGIEVCHVPDYGAHVVAEHAFALLLAIAKNVVRADTYVKSGRRFDFEPFLGTELKDKTIGVIGTGKIGAEVIRIANGFGMRVVAFDVYQNLPLAEKYGFNYMSLEELLVQSDFITLHAPLTPGTHHLINADSILRMKRGAMLVNAARGGLVDSQALKAGLESGHIAAAAVDVLEEEDDPGSDPLLNAPNLVITPHSAFFTREALERIARTTLEIIQSYKKGKILNRVPTEYL
ncbi:MAG: hydroxyacid dehydrogenase [Methanomassiliicoccales archaeon]|nr:hydroxyacid dehydrogenase [Methanomassiliicoccales archaeon]NYT15951.1 hydroxyacid dehydrogenase [Methanomassiliicoccales archaeon]